MGTTEKYGGKLVTLHAGRERSVIKRHPWIFASAIASVHGDPEPGDTVEILTQDGQWVARGAYSPQSKIRIRIWTHDEQIEVGEELLQRRLDQAIGKRSSLLEAEDTNAYREVYAESDRMPGLIVDRYADVRVIQFLTAGAEKWREVILQILVERGDSTGIFERSDVKVRELEGLSKRAAVLAGSIPEDPIEIKESGYRYRVNIREGHKTGFYLDQRENRRLFRKMVAHEALVLDCFSYTGAFSMLALDAGASEVVAIESSSSSLDLAQENIKLNDLPIERWEGVNDDVFHVLRGFRDRDKSFDMIVLDPPKFAATPAHVQRAARGYKDINLLALKLLRPKGILFTFSCSGGLSVELFQKIVWGAALDAGKRVSILRWLNQPEDHPVTLNYPEGRYLKGLVCRVEEGD